MILEGIVTTQNPDGSTNVSPMGPRVTPAFDRFLLRPFATSTTWQNLRRHPYGVLHVTDNVELMALAAIGRLPPPPLVSVPGCDVPRLADTCRWYAFRARVVDESSERKALECETIASGRVRDFFGFHRARHAVLEGAILATRTKLLPPEEIRSEFQRLSMIVEKTGSEAEHRALAALKAYLDEQLPS